MKNERTLGGRLFAKIDGWLDQPRDCVGCGSVVRGGGYCGECAQWGTPGIRTALKNAVRNVRTMDDVTLHRTYTEYRRRLDEAVNKKSRGGTLNASSSLIDAAGPYYPTDALGAMLKPLEWAAALGIFAFAALKDYSRTPEGRNRSHDSEVFVSVLDREISEEHSSRLRHVESYQELLYPTLRPGERMDLPDHVRSRMEKSLERMEKSLDDSRARARVPDGKGPRCSRCGHQWWNVGRDGEALRLGKVPGCPCSCHNKDG
jgi:hypothetical protein